MASWQGWGFLWVSVIFLQTAALMTPSVRGTPDDARKGQFLAALPGLWREKTLIGAANRLFSLFMTALVDACSLGYAFVARFRQLGLQSAKP